MGSHPFLGLGPEYKDEVGCIKCLRVAPRETWERHDWNCPHGLGDRQIGLTNRACKGTPKDVYPPMKALELRRVIREEEEAG